MKRLFCTKSIAAAAVVLGAFGAATAAHARSDVVVSAGVQVPGAHVQPAPVYVQPQPAYMEHRPVYVQPQRWESGEPYGDRDHDGTPNVYDRHDNRHHDRYVQVRGPWGDFDGDGVPNRYDRFPANPYRR
jgi:hypothetical protein